MTCDTRVGSLLSINGLPVSFDALPQHAFKIEFAKIPNTVFFVQGVTFPSVSVAPAERTTGVMFDFQEIGTKIVHQPLSIQFLVDAEMRNHSEIYAWMQAMTSSTKLEDQVGDAMLFINNKKYVRFIDAFPLNLGTIQLQSNQDSMNYVTCSADFNFDWFEIFTI